MEINQRPKLPEKPLPIAIIGAGGIIRDAHLPAYEKVGFPVLGVYDVNTEKAQEIKKTFNAVQRVYNSLDKLIAAASKENAVYDVAVPAKYILDILQKIPHGSCILIQKPMGETLEEAKAILKLCNEKNFVAGINFQLRYAPYMIAAKQIIDQGLLGDIYDMEINVNVYTPWNLWDFLYALPRMEILYHSIHYIDLIRSFLGMPEKVYARTNKHPKMPALASTKTTMILDYGEFLQTRILTNHGHEFGLKHQSSFLKIEGTKGAIKIKIGLSLDYPKGRPPQFEYFILDKHTEWQEVPLIGGWFPDAFIGTMAELQNHYQDRSKPLPHGVADAYKTMRLVEAAYQSSEFGGTLINSIQ